MNINIRKHQTKNKSSWISRRLPAPKHSGYQHSRPHHWWLFSYLRLRQASGPWKISRGGWRDTNVPYPLVNHRKTHWKTIGKPIGNWKFYGIEWEYLMIHPLVNHRKTIGNWKFNGIEWEFKAMKIIICQRYPLVKVYITSENQTF